MELVTVKIRCLTDGAHVMGCRLRAGQELEMAVAEGDLPHLVVREAAGDISIQTEGVHFDAFKLGISQEQRKADDERAEAAKAAK